MLPHSLKLYPTSNLLGQIPDSPDALNMNEEFLKEAIRQELSHLLPMNPHLCAYILDPTQREYTGREETQAQFYEILAELRRDQEEQTRKWEVNQEEFLRLYEESLAQAKKHEQSIGALSRRLQLSTKRKH